MIRSLEIENFKGIHNPVKLDLRPVTLLFGANNAGKSTIIHALHYLHEILTTGRTDVDRTELGGGTVDLGGFGSVIHAHEHTRSIRMRVGLDVTARSLPAQEARYSEYDFLALDIDDEVEALWLEVEVARTGLRRVQIGLNDDPAPLAIIEPGPHGKPSSLVLNTEHAVVLRDDDGVPVLDVAMEDAPGVQRGPDGWLVPMSPYAGPLPHRDADLFEALSEEWQSTNVALVSTLNRLIVGGISSIRNCLVEAIYIGPLREIPIRGARPQRTAARGRWAEGLAAWDALSGPEVVASANRWLERLSVGVHAKLVERLELESSTLRFFEKERNRLAHAQGRDPLAAEPGFIAALHLLISAPRERVLKLVDRSSGVALEPADLGVGVSQVVPIIVAATMGDRSKAALPGGEEHRPPSIVMLEQPELHAHPAIQVGLGDMFAEASRSRQFIVETHSEHLMLRLLRRIQETTDGELPEGAPRVTPDDLAVIYVEEVDGRTTTKALRIDETGEFVDRWPRGFFEERAEELF